MGTCCRRRSLIGAVLLAATCCSAAARSAEALDGSPVAETSGCSTRLLGKIVVATLNRAPFMTLAANGHSVTLIVDTGAERTVLTPEAAKAIDAQRPSIEFQRRVHGVGGDLASHEVRIAQLRCRGSTDPMAATRCRFGEDGE